MTEKILTRREIPALQKTNVPVFAGFELGATASTTSEKHSFEMQTFAERPAITARAWWRYSGADRPPLRIGLLLDGPELSNVSAAAIEDIQASNFATIELAVYRKSVVTPHPRGGRFRRVTNAH